MIDEKHENAKLQLESDNKLAELNKQFDRLKIDSKWLIFFPLIVTTLTMILSSVGIETDLTMLFVYLGVLAFTYSMNERLNVLHSLLNEWSRQAKASQKNAK